MAFTAEISFSLKFVEGALHTVWEAWQNTQDNRSNLAGWN